MSLSTPFSSLECLVQESGRRKRSEKGSMASFIDSRLSLGAICLKNIIILRFSRMTRSAYVVNMPPHSYTGREGENSVRSTRGERCDIFAQPPPRLRRTAKQKIENKSVSSSAEYHRTCAPVCVCVCIFSSSLSIVVVCGFCKRKSEKMCVPKLALTSVAFFLWLLRQNAASRRFSETFRSSSWRFFFFLNVFHSDRFKCHRFPQVC